MPTDYSRIHRLLKIITLVQARPDWNAPRLAEECETSPRNLYRDLKELRGAGVPIDFDEARGGYRIRRDFFLPAVHLTGEEAIALALLCEEIGSREQVPFLKPAWRALNKIESMLPEAIQQDLGALRGAVAIQGARTNPPDGHKDVYDRIADAIRDRCTLECRYDSANPDSNPEETFRFDPYALYFGLRAWYAIGRHHGRDDIRSLKLSRFTACTRTDEVFERPEKFSIEAHHGYAWRMIKGPRHEVEIWFDAAFAQTMADTRWHPTQEIEEHLDGSATFRCTVDGLDEIVWWVLSMGPHCVVKAPSELAQRVRDLAARTAAHYGE
jgi:predicted DNA-binding transcriptional regulator YafY